MAELPHDGPPRYDDGTAWQYKSDAVWGYGTGHGGASSGQRAAASTGQNGVVETMLVSLARTVWAFGLELLCVTVLCTPGIVGAAEDRPVLGGLGSASLLGILLGTGLTRRLTTRMLHATMVRRSWHRAVRALDRAGNQSLRGQLVAISKIQRRPAGDLLEVRVPVGSTVGDLERAAEALAAVLEIREVRVRRDADNARKAWVTLVRRDPLSIPAPPWPHAQAARLSLWDPIPVGINEDGQPVTLSLPERNVLLGGEPGAGKSAALSLLVATAALDPTVRLHLLDGKLVELAGWAGCADSTAGVDVEDANLLLQRLRAAMDARYLALLANRARKVQPDSGLPLHLVVVDELAYYLLNGDRKDRALFAELMRDLVARGRAAGIIVIAATQKPQHDVIPTALRDLFGFRWALRCSTPQASDTVLGAGWAGQGHTASGIDSAHRGVGLLLHEGERPVRLRSHYLDDDALASIAARAEDLRRNTQSEASAEKDSRR
jgi:hypothetical protein